MTNIPSINCQNIPFSAELASRRISKACQLFGIGIIRRVLCWTLYLLGVDRTTIAQLLEIPLETTKSLLKTIQRDGLPALEDRRQKSSSFLPASVTPVPKIAINRDDKEVQIIFNNVQKITIPTTKPFQLRIVILSLLRNHLISMQEAANTLALSISQVQNLTRESVMLMLLSINAKANSSIIA